MRISGTMASLAGLEQAIEEDDEEKKELAIRRMMLLHGITLSIGGIPLLYLGEEWGMLNDYDFVKDPAKAAIRVGFIVPRCNGSTWRNWTITSNRETDRSANESSSRRRD